MVYTLIIDGRSYDLPKKTLSVMEEMEKVSNIDSVKGLSIRDKFKKLHDFISSMVGTENANEILGSDNIDDVDLSDVTITFKKIIDAYDKPINDYAQEVSREKIRSIPIDDISKLIDATNKFETKK